MMKINDEGFTLLNGKIDSVIENQKDMLKMILSIKNDMNDIKIKQSTYENELLNRERRLSELEISQKDLQHWRSFVRGALFVGGILLGIISTVIAGVITHLINNQP